MKQSPKIRIFIIFGIIIITFFVYFIYSNWSIVARGEKYLFQAALIDPKDPFIGAYVAIDFKHNYIEVNECQFERGRQVFLTVAKDEQGFGFFSELLIHRPNNNHYYETTVTYLSRDIDNRCLVFFKLPNRFYLSEKIAERAEEIYFENIGQIYLETYIRGGKMILKDIYLDDIRLIDYINQK
jgi:hypothetical protein